MTNQQYVLAFDGQDDYVNLGKKSEFKVEKNITLEAWINVAAQKQWAGIICNIFDTGNTESGYGLLLDGSSGFYFGLKLSSLPINYPYSGANTINLSQWHHIAGTYDGQHMRFYIDGVEIFKNPIAGNKLEYNPENDLLIGMYKDDNESYAFRGKIAEVRLWNVVRSSDEIKANMKQRLKGNEAGLVGYWPLNESSGNTVTDKTGKGNNGTINGATWVQEELPIQPTPLNLVTNSKIKLKSWKGDYLHRPDTAQGVDTGGTGAVSEWIIESIGDNKIKLKSSKGDYLHRPDTVQGVTTWGTGIGNEWIVELIGDKKIKLKSWKGDYLHRPDTAQGVTTWGTGIGNEWMVEFISTEKPPTSQTLEDGLIAHYLFDSNAQDTSGHNLHGTVHGATLTTDRFGIPESAYQFDGVDDYIEVPHNDLLNLTDNLTISLWLKQEAGKAAGYRLVEKGSYGVNDGYNFDTYDGSTGRKLRLCGGVQNAQANTVYSLNEWHHVAVVFSKGVSTFYLDGKPDGSAPHGSPSIRTNSLSLLIGSARGSKAEFFKGALDDIRIYNRALSEQQIKAIHQLPSRKPQVKTGKIVVNGDEWTLSNDGIKVAPDGAVFATNIAKWFVGDRPGKFHAYSTNFGLTQSALAEAMKKVGHTWTTGTNIKFDLPTLLTYDGIFVGGDAADNQVLIEYVKAGGNVYIMAGTGWGGAQGEADHWNPFLNAFGFKLLGEYNDVRGNQPINYSHPILAGVKELYQQSTNPIVNLDGASGKNQLILTRSNGQGLIATFEGTSGTAVTLGGNTVDDKAYADTRSKFYLVDTNSPINGVGEVTGWEIWAENTLPVQLIIYRKAANSWSVVGQSEVKTPVVGFNDFSLSAPIKVEKGDFVGAYYPQQGSVSFSKPDNEAWDLGNLNGKVLFTGSGAASTAFSGSSNRIYSIRVKGNLA
ncbi:MAG TPA: LamG domain-containing protein [Waterburya sp.]|jgi:hypothetical protein